MIESYGKRKHFELSDRKEPNLYRDVFPYSQIPRIIFDNLYVRPDMPQDIWITDTTFRDGQQARPPYTPEQIVAIYGLLHKLGGTTGVIRQSEFFVYSRRDREAVDGCLELGYTYPEITGWIRADKNDFGIIKEIGLRETGILTSVSDYHIYLKLKSTRQKILEHYLEIVSTALDAGIIPRCHFEDVTRADIYGFCLPFAERLLELMRQSGLPVKIRLCDTLGFGISYPGVSLPRSIPKLVHAFIHELGYPGRLLEWHGHNDFHKVQVNAATAWLYGIGALNASLLGFGERTGNPPLEGALIEYIALTGDRNGIDTTVITEIADYYRNEVRADIPANYPFVGSEFNTTRAGIHADGLLKNPEIYNIFDTEALLNRKIKIMVTDKSGIAGIARWINDNISSIASGKREPVSKRHPGIRHINDWISLQYADGRTTSISPEELTAQTKHFLPSLFESDFEKVLKTVKSIAMHMAEHIADSPEVQSLAMSRIEKFLTTVINREKSIQLLAVTNLEGFRISQVHTQRGEKALFRNLMNKNFKKHEWFVKVLETGQPYFSDLFFSKYTSILILTAALPLKDADNKMYAIVDIDFKFHELVKLVNSIPEEILTVP